MTDGSSNAIRDVIKEVVADQHAPAQMVQLTVTEAEDADGDPIFDIVVVFKAEDDRLDPDRVLGLTRHLREPLHKLGESRFPIWWFMTSEEADSAAWSDFQRQEVVGRRSSGSAKAIGSQKSTEHGLLCHVPSPLSELRRYLGRHDQGQ